MSLSFPNSLKSIRGLPISDAFRWIGLASFFLSATIVQTWPLVIHITDSIADSPSAPLPDVYAMLWNLSWVKQAIVDLHTNPFHTDFLFFPDGENLYLHPLTLVNGLLSIPLQLATGNLILSWNILAVLFFVLSALGVYTLTYRITNNHLAGLLAGYIFAFAPVVLMQFNGRWHISTTWPIPLIALFLFRFLDSWRLREAAAAGICWALLLYNNQEYALDAALFLVAFFLYWSFVYLRRSDSARLKDLWRGGVVLAVTWLVIGAPLIIGAWKATHSGEYVLAHQDEYYSADLLSFVTPSPLWGPGEDPVGFNAVHDPIGSIENTLYLGGVPLILATLAIFTIRRTPHPVLFWGIIFLVFVILSLGPYLYVDGVKRLSVPLPYQIYDQLPLFGDRRVPSRMLPFGMMGLSVLAGVGLEVLLAWLRRYYKLLASLAAVLVFSLVVLEYWNPPAHVSRLVAPAVLEQIRDEPGDFAVLDAPLGRRDGWLHNGHFEGANISDYYAMIYKKRILGGFLARIKDARRAWLRTEPGLRYLAFPKEMPLPDDLDPKAVRDVLRKYDVKYIVLHKVGPHGQRIDDESTLASMDAYIRTVAGLTIQASDTSMIVYRNQDVQ